MTLAPCFVTIDCGFAGAAGVVDGRTAEVQRLVGVGATVLAEHAFPECRRMVLADPEINEYCVSG